ncbi:MAG: radical SAM protein [Candidatus Melainabacteria bacterium]|nr:radical SAM protein [Candidatus Melainabacteria bacterium]
MQTETLLFKRQSGGPLHVLNCFPNTYAVGMASLGFQSIFKLYASNPNTHTFRYFTDWSENHPKDIDLLTFSISWELDFINLLDIFKQLNIPFKAADRGPEHPLILGGGPVLTANPEPWAEFFDLIAIGDCEENTGQIIETALDVKEQGVRNRKKGLAEFLSVPGIYLPSLKNKVERQKSKSSDLQMSSVIAPDSAWQDTALLEVARSCPEMCRFCMASYLSLPFRAAPLEQNLIPKADQLLEYSNNIGLLGASVTQHPEFMALLKYLVKHPKKPKVQVASMRAATVTKEMCELLVESGTKNLTIAIETGSQRLRDIINKKLPEEFIFSACKYAFEGGIKQVKLYGMVGLPHETEEDIDATIDLLTRLKQATPQLKIVWGCSIFTPKAQTPFQDYGVDKTAESKLKRLIKALKPQGIDVRDESFKWAQVQALISRGDRSINDVLIKVAQSKNTGFGIYKKLLDPDHYKHWVFDTWDAMTEYPWTALVSKKQKEMLEEHKQIATNLSL